MGPGQLNSAAITKHLANPAPQLPSHHVTNTRSHHATKQPEPFTVVARID